MSEWNSLWVLDGDCDMADTSNFAQPSIPKFDGDYNHWSMLMENLLRSKEYWSIVETGYI